MFMSICLNYLPSLAAPPSFSPPTSWKTQITVEGTRPARCTLCPDKCKLVAAFQLSFPLSVPHTLVGARGSPFGLRRPLWVRCVCAPWRSMSCFRKVHEMWLPLPRLDGVVVGWLGPSGCWLRLQPLLGLGVLSVVVF
ncbi:hypothetical protein N656DRAFT_617826 [Canariomyces notabilis]|uniref:Uncharacterized protein n=1 Tax=Canariomyces notabilis TaxID=2074819 RepID=A0AAN6TFD6_9PEZI|nr:hypothetical protein N656DRAFT_617826 [Canariomyces arenarius]